MQPTRTTIRAAASQWQADIQPTHHLRLSLCQARCNDPIGKRSWLHGDEISYEEVYQRFVRSLSKRLAPNRNVWKRFKPIIPNMGCLHGKQGNTSWHFHINLRISERVNEETLMREVLLGAYHEPWVPNGPEYVNLSRIRSGDRAIFYTMKEGFDHVIGVPWERTSRPT